MNKQLNLEQLKNFKSILKDGKERIKNTYFAEEKENRDK